MNIRTPSVALIGGILAWAAVSADSALPLLSQDALLARAAKGADVPLVLDVRTPDEYVSGHVPGAVNIPHDQLAQRLAEVPKDRDVVLYCRSGRRTEIAGRVLTGNGYTRLQHLEGDIIAWVEKDRPVEKPRDAAACLEALKAGLPAQQACAAN
jgi:rhodanese-related sulfurtransferase